MKVNHIFIFCDNDDLIEFKSTKKEYLKLKFSKNSKIIKQFKNANLIIEC